MPTMNLSCSNLVEMLCLLLMISTRLSSASKVDNLPGFDGSLPFHLETGYVTVDEESGSEYFYYFVESERNPSEDPLLLWLVGGPYCSSFIGLAIDIGPLNIDGDAYNNTSITLVYNPFSWTKISSIIFVDWPVGAGFSFSRNILSYRSDDIRSSKEIYNFLKKWFLRYPHFLSNPFYVGGDSYGGKIVPIVTTEIIQGNEDRHQPLFINIKGYLIGNGLTVEKDDLMSRVPRAHGLGIIPDELFELILETCKGNDYGHPENAHCAANLKTFKELISDINLENILTPFCPDTLREKRMTGDIRSILEKSTEFLDPASGIDHAVCRKNGQLLANIWSNNHLTREALHIKEGTSEKWHHCRWDLKANYTINIQNTVPYHFNLTTKGYRALVYSGDHDLMIPFSGTLEWIKSLNFSVMEVWRSWHAGGQVAGYTVLFSNNLTFATVLGGSHTPSHNRPIQCFAMFERWMSHKLL